MPNLRDRRKDCHCWPITEWGDRDSAIECRWGCVWFICPSCGRRQGGWGEVGCKCGKYIRSWKHPGMAVPYSKDPPFDDIHAPIKPSLRKPARWR